MKVLVTKMAKLGLLKVELIGGIVLMALAIIALPVGGYFGLGDVFFEPSILLVLGIAMVIFALIAYFVFIRPFFLYRKTPTVQLEADDEFLYVHTIKKDVKIPLASIDYVNVSANLPYIYQKEFLNELVVHLFSEEYGNVVIDIPGYPDFKLRFVPHATQVTYDLQAFFQSYMDNAQ